MGALAELIKLGIKTAAKQADEVVPRVVSKVDDQLLNLKYTRETPKTEGGFSSVDLAAEGKITDQEAIGGLFNPYTFKNKEMIIGPNASNLNTSRIEISTFDPASTPSPLGFGMKAADDIGLPATDVGNKTKESMTVKSNLIEKAGGLWKWNGKPPEGFENNTHLVTIDGGPKLKKAVGKNLGIPEGPSDHAYATKVIYEKGGNLSTYDTRGSTTRKSGMSISESRDMYKIELPKKIEELTKKLKAEGKSPKEIKKEVDKLRKRLDHEYKGANPKGRPTTVGTPEFGIKIGEILRGKIIHPVYDQIIMKEEGGQVLPVIKREAGGGAYDEDLGKAYEAQANAAVQAAFDAEAMYNTEDWTTPKAMGALRAAEAPSKGNANTDDYGPDGLYNLGYDHQELRGIRSARLAGQKQDALDRQNEGDGDIPYLSGNTRYDTNRYHYAKGPLTSQQMMDDFIYNKIDQSKARKNYEEKRGAWLTTLVNTDRATPQQKAELETLKGLTYKHDPEDFFGKQEIKEELYENFDRDGKPTPEYSERIEANRARLNPKFGGGQVLDGLDGEYMRQRNSKEKLEKIIERQHGGGLDDTYLNMSRRRSNAFADPNANTAFDSPMSIGGLPTVYRANGGFMDDADAQAYADVYGPADPTDDGLGAVLGGGGPPGGAPTAAPIYFSRPDPEDPFGEPRSITTPAPPPEEPIFDERISPGHPSIRAKAPIWEMSTGSETMLRDTLRRFGDSDVLFDKMTDQQKRNFESAYHGKNFLGDINADDFSKGYRFGGAEGTLQDILEQSIASDMDINDLILQKEYRDIHAKEFEKSQRELSGIELVGAGLMDFAKQITDLTSIQPDLKNDPYIMDQIMERAEAAGLNPQPVSSFGSKLLDYGIPLIAGLPGTIMKGLHNLSGAGNTIMTVTKDGVEYNVSDTGKFSLNMPDVDIDYGNEPTPVRKPKPVQQKAAPVTEEKPLTGIKALFAKKDKPISRYDSNKYNRELLASLGYDNINLG